MKKKKLKNVGVKVAIVTIIINALLSIFKLLAGFLGTSSAMISDGIHSFSDVISTVIVMLGLKLSAKDADEEHPYGHERIESIAAIMLATMLFITGLLIGFAGLKNILLVSNDNIKKPTVISLIAAIISIIVKEFMYWYTIHYAKILKSDSLKADAWHHRSDALSSIGSLIGIAGAMLGFVKLDSIASIIICFFILKVSLEIFRDSIIKIDDHSCDEQTISMIKQLVMESNDVIEIDYLKTRLFGNKIYIDLEISADKNMSFEDAHNLAHEVHDKIEKELIDVKHCMVHINPR